MLSGRKKYKLIFVLCLLMPLHSMLIDKIVGPRTTGLINLWRDFIISVLFISGPIVISRKKKYISICLCILWFVACALASSLSGRSMAYLVLNTARTYIMPMILFIALTGTYLSEDQYKNIARLMWLQGIALTFFGAFQVFVLGKQFLLGLGYGGGNQLSVSFYINGFYGFQRMVSTFSSPNDCGLYLSGLFIVSLISRSWIEQKYKKTYIFGMIIIFIGIILTFSRTSLLAVTITSLIYYFRSRKQRIKAKKILGYSVLVVVLFLLAVYMDNRFLGSRVVNMFSSSISSTIRKTDASFLKHIDDLILPAKNVIYHPLGYGMGLNGPVAVSALGESVAHAVESSIWLIGYDAGIIGVLLYYYPFVSLLRGVFSKRKSMIEQKIPAYLALCTTILFLTLPYCSSYESTFLMFLFAGLGERIEKKRKMFPKM